MGRILSKFRKNSSSSSSSPYAPTDSSPNLTQSNDNNTNNLSRNRAEKYQETTQSTLTSMKLRQINTFSCENVLSIDAGPASTCIFGIGDCSLKSLDFSNDKIVKNWTGHERDITRVMYCARIDRYVSASRDKTIRMWSLSNEKAEMTVNAHDLVVTAVAADPDNKLIVSGSRDNFTKLWDVRTGKLLKSVQVSRNLITDSCWSNDGRMLFQTSEDKQNRLWDPKNLTIIYGFPNKQYIQSSCHISSDNNYAISTSNGFEGNGCEISVWDLRKMSLLVELMGHVQTVTSAKIISGDRFIASCSNDSTVKLWDFKSFKMIESIYLSNSLTSICESSSKNNNLLVSSLNNGIHLLSLNV